jgi:hypothetical protein
LPFKNAPKNCLKLKSSIIQTPVRDSSHFPGSL